MVVRGSEKGTGKVGIERGEIGIVEGVGAIQEVEVGVGIARIVRVGTTARGMPVAALALEDAWMGQMRQALVKSQGRRKERRRRRMMGQTTRIQRLQRQTVSGHPLE